ncbi:hypothetical protein D4764_21G0005780 [Takifugu flavidus]|uniref:Uncharacterized protein n=1 Tax=Takifugu flavidus TaxID=433684 RepID=A0A5C6NFM0_9TELE|nr:hypothetical protein D4764_21G0005780 [Takifugu flavidus]
MTTVCFVFVFFNKSPYKHMQVHHKMDMSYRLFDHEVAAVSQALQWCPTDLSECKGLSSIPFDIEPITQPQMVVYCGL